MTETLIPQGFLSYRLLYNTYMNKQQTNWNESFKMGRDYNPLNEIILDKILSEIKNAKRIAIDLGCGTGDSMVKLAKRGMRVTGVDWSSDALEKAKKRTKEACVLELTSFVEADLNNLTEVKLSKGKSDIVLCKLVIAFVDNKKKFCEEAKSLLGTNGVFILITPVLHRNVNYNLEDKPNIAVYYDEMIEILGNVFTNVKELNHSYYSEKGDLVTFLLQK